MAKQVIWSVTAVNDRRQILEYWILNNHSKAYSVKLNALFKQAIKLISQYPFIGKPTDIKEVRAKRVRDYYIFYRETKTQIHILTIWDTRQDPKRLKVKA